MWLGSDQAVAGEDAPDGRHRGHGVDGDAEVVGDGVRATVMAGVGELVAEPDDGRSDVDADLVRTGSRTSRARCEGLVATRAVSRGRSSCARPRGCGRVGWGCAPRGRRRRPSGAPGPSGGTSPSKVSTSSRTSLDSPWPGNRGTGQAHQHPAYVERPGSGASASCIGAESATGDESKVRGAVRRGMTKSAANTSAATTTRARKTPCAAS